MSVSRRGVACGIREPSLRIFFRYIASTIPLSLWAQTSMTTLSPSSKALMLWKTKFGSSSNDAATPPRLRSIRWTIEGCEPSQT